MKPVLFEKITYAVAEIAKMNGVDSLNVAVAAGLAMWELTQHRNQ